MQNTISTKAPVSGPRLKAKPLPIETPAQPESTQTDKLELNWSGSKPAHRNVKKLTRALAFGVGLVGLGVTALAASSLAGAAIGVGLTAAALTALDIGSGLAHHAGDNYLKPSLPHTQWHTEPDKAEYCLVGFSNKALDSIEFWPKWENFIHKTTGAEPISWKVTDYKAYCQGKISAEELEQSQIQSGQLKP